MSQCSKAKKLYPRGLLFAAATLPVIFSIRTAFSPKASCLSHEGPRLLRFPLRRPPGGFLLFIVLDSSTFLTPKKSDDSGPKDTQHEGPVVLLCTPLSSTAALTLPCFQVPPELPLSRPYPVLLSFREFLVLYPNLFFPPPQIQGRALLDPLL